MKLEMTKSAVLSLLVLLSLILTWSLWTFQPQYNFKEYAKDVHNVSIGEKRQFNEIIKPTQFIYHQNGLHYGLTNHLLNDEVYKMIMDLNVLEYEHISYFSKEQLQSFLYQDDSLEMIFPVSLPINIINFIMGPIRQEWDIKYFDRIVVNFNNGSSIYFVSSKDDQLIKMKIDDDAINSVKEKLTKEKIGYSTYFSLNVGSGDILYLPENLVMLNQLTFSTQNLAPSEFKNALFADLSQVKQYGANSTDEYYTDGSEALEINYDQNMMRFINPAKQEIYDMEPEEMILKSIEFINDHSGWTDSFSLIDWNKSQQTLIYRLLINGYPVFAPNGNSIIYQSWRENEIYEYQRSLINLRFSIESEQKQVVLPSGRKLLSYLTNIEPNFNVSLLENALIGFEFTRENTNTTVAIVKPKWFVKYNGKWDVIDISSTVTDQGGNKLGLE